MAETVLSVVIGAALASSFYSATKESKNSISEIGSQIKKLDDTKIDIKRFKELQKSAKENSVEFNTLSKKFKTMGIDATNLSAKTKGLNQELLKLKKNALIDAKIESEKSKLGSQKGSLMATVGTGMAIGGLVRLQSEVMQAQGELQSLKIDDVGIEKITKQAKEFSNQFAGTTTPEFIKAAYDIKSGISSLGDEAVGSFTRLAAITAGATKSSTSQMTSFFATGFGIYSKQFYSLGEKTIEGWENLSQEEKDIKFGEYFSAGIGSAVQMFKTEGSKMQSAIETLGAAATTSNVPLHEQLAILGQMQKSFASGSEAATAYKGFLSGAVKAQGELGMEFLDSNNQLKSSTEILDLLRDRYGDVLDDLEKKEIKDAFGTEEGLKFITTLYDEVDVLKGNMDELGTSMSKGTTTVDEMMRNTQKGKEFQLFTQQIGNLGASIGKIFYPAITAVTATIGSLVVGLDTLIETYPTISSGIGYLVGGFFTMIVAIKTATVVSSIYTITKLTLAKAILNSTIKTKLLTTATTIWSARAKIGAVASGIFSTSLKLLGGALAFAGKMVFWLGKALLTTPIGWAVAIIAGGAYLITKNWEGVKGFFGGLWDGIKNIFSGFLDFTKGVFSFSPLGLIMSNWEPMFEWITNKFEIVTDVIDTFKSVGSSIAGLFGFGGEDESKEKKSGVGDVAKKVTATPVQTSDPFMDAYWARQRQNYRETDERMNANPNIKAETSYVPIEPVLPKIEARSAANQRYMEKLEEQKKQSINQASDISVNFTGDIVVNSTDGKIAPNSELQVQLQEQVRKALAQVESERKNRSFEDTI